MFVLISPLRRPRVVVDGIAILALLTILAFQISLNQPTHRKIAHASIRLTNLSSLETTSGSLNISSELLRHVLPRALPAGVSLSIHDAVCQGEAYLEMLEAAGDTKDARTPPGKLDGWTETISSAQVESTLQEIAPELAQNSHSTNYNIFARQTKPYRGLDGVERVSDFAFRA